MLVHEAVATAIEAGLVPPEAVPRPFEAHVGVAHAMLQHPPKQFAEALQQVDANSPFDLDV
eukprot:15773506-Heterocapsa_arctica.AAC.1